MGGGAAPGARVAEAARGQQRPVGGGERAEARASEAAEDPRGAGSRSANSAGLTGERPSLAAAAALRCPADRTRVGTTIPSACRAAAAATASQSRAPAGREAAAAAAAAGGARPPRGLNNGARRSGDPRVRSAAVEEAAGRRPPPPARPSLHGRPPGLGLPSSPAPRAAQPRAWCRRPARSARSNRSSPSSSSRSSRPSRGCCLWLLCEREYNSLLSSPRRLAGDRHPTRTCPLKASPGTAGECPPRADSRKTKRS